MVSYISKVYYFDEPYQCWKIYFVAATENYHGEPYLFEDIIFDEEPNMIYRFYGFRQEWHELNPHYDINIQHVFLLPLVDEGRSNFRHTQTTSRLITINPRYPSPHNPDQSIDYDNPYQNNDLIQLPVVSFMVGDFSLLDNDYLIASDLSCVVTGHHILLRQLEMTNRFYRFPIITQNEWR